MAHKARKFDCAVQVSGRISFALYDLDQQYINTKENGLCHIAENAL